MPYIAGKSVEQLKFITDQIDAMGAVTPGEINYLITQLLIKQANMHGVNYTNLNMLVGAVESAKTEFQRRVVAPYEDQKAYDNGDVYASLMP